MSSRLVIPQWQVGRPAISGNRAGTRRAITSAPSATDAHSQIPALIRWSFLLFIFSMQLEGAGLGFEGEFLSPGRIGGVPFFVACLFAPKLCFRRPSAPVWWFCAYLGFASLRSLFTPREFQQQAILSLLPILELVIFFWIAGNLLRDHALAGRALRTYALATVVIAFGTLAGIPGLAATTRQSSTDVAVRTTAFNYNPNDVAAMAALGAVVLLGVLLSVNVKPRYRLLAGAAAFPVIAFLVETASRAGIAALVVGLAVFLLPAGRTRRQLLAVLLVVGVLAGIIFVASTNALLEARVGDAYYYNDTGREYIYRAALDLIAERPIAGWGPVVALRELGARLHSHSGVRDAHNLLLHLLLEGGIIGALPFVVGLLLVVRAAWMGRKNALGMTPFALVIVVLMENVAHTCHLWKPMWLVLAVAMASAVRGKRVWRAAVPKPPVADRVSEGAIALGARHA